MFILMLRDSGLSLVAVYKESSIREFVCVIVILLSATWHLVKDVKDKQLDLEPKKN
jgi:hypothetical protein